MMCVVVAGPLLSVDALAVTMDGDATSSERARVLNEPLPASLTNLDYGKLGPWTGTGSLGDDQLVAKLTYDVRPSIRVSVAAIGRRQESEPRKSDHCFADPTGGR